MCLNYKHFSCVCLERRGQGIGKFREREREREREGERGRERERERDLEGVKQLSGGRVVNSQMAVGREGSDEIRVRTLPPDLGVKGQDRYSIASRIQDQSVQLPW